MLADQQQVYRVGMNVQHLAIRVRVLHGDGPLPVKSLGSGKRGSAQ